MQTLDRLFKQNKDWSQGLLEKDPNFFARLSEIQQPEYLWIGCSDSRVPANQVMGLEPGEVFVHRNVANVVAHSDLNCLTVVQFAVQILRVKQILLVGHYGCGGVKAALDGVRVGLADNWLRHIHDVKLKHATLLSSVPQEKKHDLLCELNVIEQVFNLGHSTVLYDAWSRGQEVSVHGLIFNLSDGLVNSLDISMHSINAIAPTYANAIARLKSRVEYQNDRQP